jgi:hypothetical protein
MPRSRENYFQRGGHTPREPVTTLGKSAAKQYTAERHYALSTIGVNAYVVDNEYFNTPYYADSRAFAWLERNRLIKRSRNTLRPEARQENLARTEDGERVKRLWDAEHGEVDTANEWDGVEAWEGC